MATILVADDEQLIRWSLSERLQADGLRVIEAATGQEAIDKVHEGVDLVLLDFKLPDIDGVTVLRQIKDTTPTSSSSCSPRMPRWTPPSRR